MHAALKQILNEIKQPKQDINLANTTTITRKMQFSSRKTGRIFIEQRHYNNKKKQIIFFSVREYLFFVLFKSLSLENWMATLQ